MQFVLFVLFGDLVLHFLGRRLRQRRPRQPGRSQQLRRVEIGRQNLVDQFRAGQRREITRQQRHGKEAQLQINGDELHVS